MTEVGRRTYLLLDRFYRPDCVDQVMKDFSALCNVDKTIAGHETRITITCLPGAPVETPEEFMNYLLCVCLEKLLA